MIRYIGYNTPNQKELSNLTVADAKKYIAAGEFAKGSMLPKIEACLNFVTGTNKTAIITSLDDASLALENKARRVIALNTSGPFHTSLLKEASLALKERFKKETFHEMKIPVIFNTLGHEIEYQSIPEILEKQVMSPVYFEKSIRYMIDQGVDTIIEVGPGKVLSGFVRKIDRSIQLYQIEDMESLKKTVKALKGE